MCSKLDPLTGRAYLHGWSYCDALGIQHFEVGDLFANRTDHLDELFPALNTGVVLSRGRGYYDVRYGLRFLTRLSSFLRHAYDVGWETTTLGEKEFQSAALDNAFNMAAALTFALWEICVDNPNTSEGELLLLSLMQQQLENIAAQHIWLLMSPELRQTVDGSAVHAVEWEVFTRACAIVPECTPLRQFREFDNKYKVMDEIRYLSHELAPSCEATVVLFPLYGSLSLGCYFSAYQRLRMHSGKPTLPILFARIGFHDLKFLELDRVDAHAILMRAVPASWVTGFLECLDGACVLIVDDNVGYGSTLRACKRLVVESGGSPLARSAETAWHLFRRRGAKHCVSDAVDYPGLRTNFHHSMCVYRINMLCDSRYVDYQEISKIDILISNLTQMEENLNLARICGDWESYQITHMEREIDFARHHWCPTGVPEFGNKRD